MTTETNLPDDEESVRRRKAFYTFAHARYLAFLVSGEDIPWEDISKYLLDRAADKPCELPNRRNSTYEWTCGSGSFNSTTRIHVL